LLEQFDPRAHPCSCSARVASVPHASSIFATDHDADTRIMDSIDAKAVLLRAGAATVRRTAV
jgi:hypothetical protein